MHSIGVGLMGLGVIGGQVARVLQDKADMLSEQVGCRLILRKIKVLPEDLDRPLAKELPRQLFTTVDDEFFAEPGIDIIVETIGGESPALEYIRRAISGGRHVVTANKEVIAKHGAELLALSQQQEVGLQEFGQAKTLFAKLAIRAIVDLNATVCGIVRAVAVYPQE